MPSISIVAILVPPEPPVPINRHLLGGERKGWMPRGVGGTSSSSFSSSTKTAGDVPSCPCGLSAHPPPLSGPPSPPLQTPPLFISAQHPTSPLSGPMGRIYSSVSRPPAAAAQKESSGAQSKFFPTNQPALHIVLTMIMPIGSKGFFRFTIHQSGFKFAFVRTASALISSRKTRNSTFCDQK